MTSSSINSTNKVERVYIGGLDPPRLTVFDLKKRLHSIPGISILSIDDGSATNEQQFNHSLSRTFLFLDICLTDDHDNNHKTSATKSAFDILSSRYHNVRWKGCRLVVETARPHFLKRLEQERQDAQQRKVSFQNSTITETKESNDLICNENIIKENKSIPRQLRIRRKHGEEAIKVDTKPREVHDFTHLAKCLQKQRKAHANNRSVSREMDNKFKRQKQALMTTAKPKPIIHRSLHIKFEDDFNDERENNNRCNKDSKNNQKLLNASIASQESIVTRSDPPNINENAPNTDSENDDSDSDNESKNGSSTSSHSTSTPSTINENKLQYAWSDSESDSETEPKSKSTSESVYNTQVTTTTPKSFVWSDDDSDKEVEIEKPNDVKLVSKNDAHDNNNNHNENDQDVDLSNDVKSNLSILSQLFTNIDTNPHELTTIKSSSRKSSSSQDGSNGLSSFGLIQRFDPTDQRSIQQFQVQGSNSDGNHNYTDDFSDSNDQTADKKINANRNMVNSPNLEDEGVEEETHNVQTDESDQDAESDHEKKNESDGDHNDMNKTIEKTNQNDNNINASTSLSSPSLSTTEEKDDQSYIYKQSKLESIFKQARQQDYIQQAQANGFKISQTFQDNLSNVEDNDKSANNTKQRMDDSMNIAAPETGGGGGGGFSFSFQMDLHEDAISSNDNSQPSNTKRVNHDNNDKDEIRRPSTTATDNESQQSAQKNTLTTPYMYSFSIKRHEGLQFYKPLLNEWVEHFYSLNSNDDINDKEQNVNQTIHQTEDDNDTEKWLEKRKMLTRDWKRKHKHALLRTKKKRTRHA